MQKSKTSIITLLLTLALLLPGLSYSANVPPSVSQLVANAKKAIKTANMAEFKAMYDKKDVGLLVDVRDPDEYAAGSFKTAVNIPTDELEKKIPTLPTDKPIVFVCNTGSRSSGRYHLDAAQWQHQDGL